MADGEPDGQLKRWIKYVVLPLLYALGFACWLVREAILFNGPAVP